MLLLFCIVLLTVLVATYLLAPRIISKHATVLDTQKIYVKVENKDPKKH
jgi:hypothetical protein